MLPLPQKCPRFDSSMWEGSHTKSFRFCPRELASVGTDAALSPTPLPPPQAHLPEQQQEELGLTIQNPHVEKMCRTAASFKTTTRSSTQLWPINKLFTCRG